ncbi:MAG: zinc-dependent metalloprotease [Bacteroidia bacterium]|nr:zinc-dependent metalloprotease [Bacteroidia bacterium]MDW8236319.1 M43 family zinc metalloprotease [Bacteroidia bacterium]
MRGIGICLGLSLLQAQIEPTIRIPCYPDVNHMLEERDPAIRAARAALEQQIQSILQQSPLRTESTCPESQYIIPVVVHVIHSGNGASDSIPAERIGLFIEKVFNQFRRRPYTRDYGDGVDTYIELSLATKDPSGNPTSGIVYYNYQTLGLSAPAIFFSDMWNPSSNFYKITNQAWNRTRYANLFVVDSICVSSGNCNIAGFAFYPNNMSEVTDAVFVITSTFDNPNLGDEGTITHEYGHFLNLRHTFNPNENLPLNNRVCEGTSASNCSSGGDGICDTPPKKSHGEAMTSLSRRNTCAEDYSLGDKPDDRPNYMDYTLNFFMTSFTQGQRNRMHAALQTASDRNTLWTSANLQQTGAGPWGKVRANFFLEGCEQPPCRVCPGQTLRLISYSMGKPHQFTWEIRQGSTVITQANSTSPCMTMTAPSTPGTYSIYLRVQNQAGNQDSVLYTNFLSVRNLSTEVASYPFSQGFDAVLFPPTGWTRINPDYQLVSPYGASLPRGTLQWDRYSLGGSFGASPRCARFMNWEGYDDGQRDHLITPLIGIPTTANNPVLEFDVFYRALYWGNETGSRPSHLLPSFNYLYADSLIVSISEDCGATWQRLYAKGGTALDVTGSPLSITDRELTSSDRPLPVAAQWRHEKVSIPPSYKGKNVLIRFENYCGLGGDLFLDSVQVRNDPTLSLAYPHYSVYLAPNPTQEEAYLIVQGAAGSTLRYELYSLMGTLLDEGQTTLTDTEHRHLIPTAGLPAGVYLLRTEMQGSTQMWKIVKE